MVDALLLKSDCTRSYKTERLLNADEARMVRIEENFWIFVAADSNLNLSSSSAEPVSSAFKKISIS